MNKRASVRDLIVGILRACLRVSGSEWRAWRRRRLSAKWKKCCRCFPAMVDLKALFCSCCGFDQRTGKTDPSWHDPDPFEASDA